LAHQLTSVPRPRSIVGKRDAGSAIDAPRRAEPLEELAAGHANALLALLDITDHATVLAVRDQLLAA
jgi:hypothetical protein